MCSPSLGAEVSQQGRALFRDPLPRLGHKVTALGPILFCPVSFRLLQKEQPKGDT